jgi:hypothetical protein
MKNQGIEDDGVFDWMLVMDDLNRHRREKEKRKAEIKRE